jgi:hypothetical protein
MPCIAASKRRTSARLPGISAFETSTSVPCTSACVVFYELRFEVSNSRWEEKIHRNFRYTNEVRYDVPQLLGMVYGVFDCK